LGSVKTIAVIARKGGSGKTTVAVHLALAAHRRQLKTWLVDTDPQGSSSEVLKARQADGPVCAPAVGAGLIDRQAAALAVGAELMLVDTPAASEGEIAHAIALAQLSVLVIRPTFLDIAASIQTAQILRRLRKPGLILLNQAPVPREGVEPPAVKKAIEALRLMRLPVIPVVLRSRAVYQTALATGQSAEELAAGGPAGEEVAQAWSFIERFVWGETRRARTG
jgi:chromosome partitioning protein